MNFGLVIKEQDSRDYVYSKTIRNPMKYAEQRPRKIINEIKNVNYQGNYGTCTGAAISHCKELNEYVDLSLLYPYKIAKEVYDKDLSYEGTSIDHIVKAICKYGIPKDELYPYSKYKKVHVFPYTSSDAVKDAEKRRAEGYVRIFNKDELLDAIWLNKSVIIGAIITDKFRFNLDFSNNGETFGDLINGSILGGHAMCVCGFDLDKEFAYSNGKKYRGFVLIQNSWRNWGFKGSKCWVPIEQLFFKLDFGMPIVPDIFAIVDKLNRTEIKMDTSAFIKDSRTFIPVSFVSQALGGNVGWNDKTREVTIKLNNNIIILKIDSDIIRVNGKRIKIDTAPFIKDDRTFVPIKFIAENLGATVDWLAMERKAEVKLDNKIVEIWIDKNIIVKTELQ